MKSLLLIPSACVIFTNLCLWAGPITTTEELEKALTEATPGKVVELAAVTFRLTRPLALKGGITLRGAGVGQTIITHAPSWTANPATLPDPETKFKEFDRTGYLLHCVNDAADITIENLSLTGSKMHGAIFGFGNQGLHLQNLHLSDFMYCGVRTFTMRGARIHDCTFLNAGQRWQKGKPGITGGITGGGIFAIWMSDTEIWNNRFLNNSTAPHEHYYGIKGREARRVRIHHNTIETNFSIELPFEGDEDVEIDHNILLGPVSIPKYAGGSVPKSGRTFHIHHNYFRDGYSIEFVRNGVEIDHNLFDFDATKDGSNLISSFGSVGAKGPAIFHNNLVSNPGRGVMWMNEPYAQLEVRNNHIITHTTKTPRTEGLFGFNEKSDFPTFHFKNNIIECIGTPRPLFRNAASRQSVIENNQLINITDTDRYANKAGQLPAGLESPLVFLCGVAGELKVDGWKATAVPVK